MMWLLHKEFMPINLAQISIVQPTGPDRISFVYPNGNSSEWVFKTNELRDEYYQEIFKMLEKKGGHLLK